MEQFIGKLDVFCNCLFKCNVGEFKYMCLRNLVQDLMDKMDIYAYVCQEDTLLGVIRFEDISYIIYCYKDDIGVLYISEEASYICYYNPLGNALSSRLKRLLACSYPNYVFNNTSTLEVPIAVSTSQSVALVVLFVLIMDKSMGSPVCIHDAVDKITTFTHEPARLDNISSALKMLCKDSDAKVRNRMQGPCFDLCNSFAKVQIEAITEDETKRREHLYRFMIKDTTLTSLKKHIKTSWRICKDNISKAMVELAYTARLKQCTVSNYTRMVESCKINIVSHYKYIVSMYEQLENHSGIEEFTSVYPIHREIEEFQYRICLVEIGANNLTDTVHMSCDTDS